MKLYFSLYALLFFISLRSMEQQPLNSTPLGNLILNVTNTQLVEEALSTASAPSFDITKSATITLESEDSVQFNVPLYIAEQLQTVKHLITEGAIPAGDPIPVSNAKSIYLQQIITALQKINTIEQSNNYIQDLVTTLNPLFNDKKLEDILELLTLVNYLDNKLLVDYFAALIAAYIQQTNNKENIDTLLKQCLLLPSDLQQLISRALRLLNPTIINELITKSSKRLIDHSCLVHAVAFSSDNKLALTTHSDFSVILWDINTGKIVRKLENHDSFILSLAFSPDSKQALTGCFDGTVIVWDLNTGKIIRVLEGHIKEVIAVAFNPNGKLALTGSIDKTARIYDVSTGNSIHTLIGHDAVISTVAFSPDGKLALTGSWDTTAILWNVNTGESIHTLRGHTGAIKAVTFSSNGKLILTVSNDNTAILWDVATGTVKHKLEGHGKYIKSIALSSDIKFALTLFADNTVRIWDVYTSNIIHVFIGHTNTINSVAFSHNGKLVLTGDDFGTVILWDLTVADRLTLPELVALIKNASSLNKEIEQVTAALTIIPSPLVGIATWAMKLLTRK